MAGGGGTVLQSLTRTDADAFREGEHAVRDDSSLARCRGRGTVLSNACTAIAMVHTWRAEHNSHIQT